MRFSHLALISAISSTNAFVPTQFGARRQFEQNTLLKSTMSADVVAEVNAVKVREAMMMRRFGSLKEEVAVVEEEVVEEEGSDEVSFRERMLIAKLEMDKKAAAAVPVAVVEEVVEDVVEEVEEAVEEVVAEEEEVEEEETAVVEEVVAEEEVVEPEEEEAVDEPVVLEEEVEPVSETKAVEVSEPVVEETKGGLIVIDEDSIQFGAGIIGGAAGLIIGGPALGALAALIVNYASKDKESVGQVVQSVSSTSIEVYNSLIQFNNKYKLVEGAQEKLGEAIQKAKNDENKETIEQLEAFYAKASSKADEVNKDYDLTGVSLTTLGVIGELFERAAQRAIDLNEEYQITEKAVESAKKAIDSTKM